MTVGELIDKLDNLIYEGKLRRDAYVEMEVSYPGSMYGSIVTDTFRVRNFELWGDDWVTLTNH